MGKKRAPVLEFRVFRVHQLSKTELERFQLGRKNLTANPLVWNCVHLSEKSRLCSDCEQRHVPLPVLWGFRFQFQKNLRHLVSQLYVRDNCHPFKASLLVWVQLPLWISLSLALRNLSLNEPGNPATSF